MILDFKEIPEAHIPNGMQDTFEMLQEIFLKKLVLLLMKVQIEEQIMDVI